ncbi:MAG: POTRA domain-containing protein, partial [Candidatus Binatia bacterium]
MMHKLWIVGAVLFIAVGQAWADDLPAPQPGAPMPEQSATPAPPVQPPVTIGTIKIEGNDRVEEEAIRVQLQSKLKEPLNADTVDKDIHAIYAMGFFRNVEAQVTKENGHVLLTYKVAERPLIREVRIEGNKDLSKDVLETAIKSHPRTILNPVKIRRGIEEAKKAYEQKGFLDVDITYRTEEVDRGETVLTFTVNERKKVYVKDLLFEGNKTFDSDALRGIINTKEKNFLSRVMVNRGVLNRDMLKTDTERLTAFYYDHGYINVRIDEPRVER